jgi:penicillin-binding protein 1A
MSPQKLWMYLSVFIVSAALLLTAMLGLAAALIYPDLPSLEALTNYQPKLPLRVYSEDGYLLAEYGEERRAFVDIKNVPEHMKSAVIAIEDRRFYKHGGIDTRGILRAAINNVTGGSKEGASTITMQVARNFFLSSERSFKRKINEALLAIKIEHNLSKDKILELYINQIYLGQRAYGFAAASQVYFGKPLEKLNLAETALLAGLPKAPSSYNPFTHPKRAITRQREVLSDMYRYKFIDEATYQDALKQPLRFKASQQSRDLAADYVGEIVRQAMFERYKDSIYSSGMNVYTTIIKSNQEAANNAVIQGVLDYDIRHGYRGPEKQIPVEELQGENAIKNIEKALDSFEPVNGLIPAAITKIYPKGIRVHTIAGEDYQIEGEGLGLIQARLNDKNNVSEKMRIRVGSIIRVMKNEATNNLSWKVAQLPQVESAAVAIDPKNGAVRALVGGFDYNRNKFNHVTQAWRQPGSSFKPFIYSAALEKGYTPATMVEDEPISFSAKFTGSGSDWTPHNFDNKYEGPMRLRTALTKSKNMVSIRVLNSIGVDYAQNYIERFGFSAKDHPAYLTMALGAGSVTPWQMAQAYAVFANGGYKVNPYIISKITDKTGNIIQMTKFVEAGNTAEQVIDSRNAYLMTSMMEDVTRIGTAAKARQLGRNDLAGKTGTTNNHIDAWFAGFNPKQVAVVWVGFDKPQSLGGNETGGSAALPIWIKYMATALQNTPEIQLPVPDGVESHKVNIVTGQQASDDEGGIYEYFYSEYPPPEKGAKNSGPKANAAVADPTESDQLY